MNKDNIIGILIFALGIAIIGMLGIAFFTLFLK